MTSRQKLRAGVNKTKRFLEFCFYWLFDNSVLALTRAPNDGAGGAAIIYLELIGDYFMWLPYGRALVQKLKATHTRVVFVCNAQWHALAGLHYPDCVLFPVEKKRFTIDLCYRRKLLHDLKNLGVATVLHPSYPREGITGDACVRALGGHATGFEVVYPDRPWIDRVINRGLYQNLLPAIPGTHQGGRYDAFLACAGIAPGTAAPLCAKALAPVGGFSGIDAPYFVLSPTASQHLKVWQADKFTEVARRILKARPDWRCVLIGTQSEWLAIEPIALALGSRAVNMAGKTSLLEMIGGIQQAQFVLGNDSSAGHIAAACGAPCVVVYHGAEYGRGQPYDHKQNAVAALPITVSHFMGCYNCGWNCRYPVRKGEPAPCVGLITVDDVWASVSSVLPE